MLSISLVAIGGSLADPLGGDTLAAALLLALVASSVVAGWSALYGP